MASSPAAKRARVAGTSRKCRACALAFSGAAVPAGMRPTTPRVSSTAPETFRSHTDGSAMCPSNRESSQHFHYHKACRLSGVNPPCAEECAGVFAVLKSAGGAAGGTRFCPHCDGDAVHQEHQCPLHPENSSASRTAARSAALRRNRELAARQHEINAHPRVVAASDALLAASEAVTTAARDLREMPVEMRGSDMWRTRADCLKVLVATKNERTASYRRIVASVEDQFPDPVAAAPPPAAAAVAAASAPITAAPTLREAMDRIAQLPRYDKVCIGKYVQNVVDVATNRGQVVRRWMVVKPKITSARDPAASAPDVLAECGICLSALRTLEFVVLRPCRHTLCGGCFEKHLRASFPNPVAGCPATCPFCRQPIEQLDHAIADFAPRFSPAAATD